MDNAPDSSLRGSVDWVVVDRVLSEINQLAPVFLSENVLIGGGACLFYRQLLASANDSDFPLPKTTPEDERLWLSKDVDVIGTAQDEIPEELGLQADEEGRCLVCGIWVDSPGAAYTFDASMARSTAVPAISNRYGTEFLVLSPALLLREKRALIQDPTKDRAQDPLHAAVAERTGKLLLCQWLERRPIEKKTIVQWHDLAKEIKEYTPDLLTDPALCRRLRAAVNDLKGNPLGKSAYHWVMHKVLNSLQPG